MSEVIQMQPKKDMVKGIIPTVASVVGGIYGGPAGAAAAGTVAGSLVKDAPMINNVSSPVDRRMDEIQSDPLSQLKAGKNALLDVDPRTRDALEPVLDEAIKKAAIEKQQI